jgi:hypothetical protein
MTAVMADNESAMGTKKKPKKPDRGEQVPFMVYLDAKLFDAIEAFRAAQQFKPSKTAIAHLALTEFVARHGFPPK